MRTDPRISQKTCWVNGMPEGSSFEARSIGLIPPGYKESHFGREVTGWSLKETTRRD